MVNRIVQDFDGDATAAVVLRLFQFMTDSMENHHREHMRIRQEREEVFSYALESISFRRVMRPIIRLYRERRMETRFSPLPPLFPDEPPSASYIYRRSPSNDSPRTVEILLQDASAVPTESSSVSFHTPTENEPISNPENELGSPQNPIDVDQLFTRQDTPPPLTEALRRTRSNPINTDQIQIPQERRSRSTPLLMYCRICARPGHFPDNCIQITPLICTYCREVGHGAQECVERRRDERRYHSELQFCIFCSQQGHSIEQCFAMHYASQ
jgi:hypothetical protein